MKVPASWVLGLLGLAASVQADPTWPSPIDELEEIMFQVFSFRSRQFAGTVFPCNNEASGPGRHQAAEWVRTAFHDMAPANVVRQNGAGLDASIQFELTSTENKGPAFTTTMAFMAPYFTKMSSMADLIALGVYFSVRACQGPVIPIRAGRVDATQAGPNGVPQPGDGATTFRNQFTRMGFTQQEMIQLTACGHTIGGVHGDQFPNLVPPGSAPNNQVGLDSTDAVFDNRIVTEYLTGNTTNPLIVGPDVGQRADLAVFASDRNVTIQTLADPATFSSVCKTVLQKMIDVVPPGVVLTEPIQPYAVKPVNLHLTLDPTATLLTFTGFIRVRITELGADALSGVTLNYRNRNGGTTCSGGPCSISLSIQGRSRGFDDDFAWYPISANLPVTSGISSFTITLNKRDGSSVLFDNNGARYPLEDAIFLQQPQSCLLQGTGAFTVVAAVRNDRADLPAKANISYKSRRTDGNPVPSLNEVTIDLTKGACVGSYTFFSASYQIPGGISAETFVDVVSGTGASAVSDSFNSVRDIGGTCQAYTPPGSCSTVSVSSSSSSPPSSSSTSVATSTASTAAPTTTLSHRQTVGGYNLVSCWKEGIGARALKGAAFAYDGMTLESCMRNCTGFAYWGTEYGRECYCGNSLDSTSVAAPLSECNMVCSGDSTQYCGAGDRLELYLTATATATASPTGTSTTRSTTSPVTSSTTSSSQATSTSSSAPAGGPSHPATVGKYSLVGCQTEAAGARALSGATTAADDMTLEKCATFCSSFTYFGTEYGRECYCGNSLPASSVSAPLGDCNMPCAGSASQYCGGPNRLDLYRVTAGGGSPGNTASTLTTTTRSTTSSAAASSTTTSSTTPASSSSTLTTSTATVQTLANRPTVSPYTLVGCWTEGNGARALSQKSTAAADMTLEKCATFCSGYAYFGTEYGSECYCGNTLHATSASAAIGDCSMTCSGNPFQYCGGGNRLTLYQTQATGPVSGPSHPATVSGFAFDGCRAEPAGGRALAAATTAADNMTLELCASFCASYTYFGTEYGRECYCANTIAAASTPAPEGECSMLCAGSGSQFCGAGNRVSVYKKP